MDMNITAETVYFNPASDVGGFQKPICEIVGGKLSCKAGDVGSWMYCDIGKADTHGFSLEGTGLTKEGGMVEGCWGLELSAV